MSTPHDGGQAFPNGPCPQFTDDSQYGERGMSLRDWFAGQALIGYLSRGDPIGAYENAAIISYRMADAMLAARPPNNGPGGTEGGQ